VRAIAVRDRPAMTKTKTTLGLLGSIGLVCLLPGLVQPHGTFDGRLAAANEQILAHPSDPRARLVRADLYRRHGEFTHALEDIEEARRLAPEFTPVEHHLGLVLLDMGRYRQAEAALRRFLADEPKHASGHAARARALLELDRPIEAAREYDAAIRDRAVASPDAYLDRARALASAGDAHLGEAVRGLDEGIAALGPILSLEREAIELDARRGSIDSALSRVDRILARLSRRETWLALRGDLLVRFGRDREAQHDFARALSELRRLPADRRGTLAMTRLEHRIEAELARLSTGVSSGLSTGLFTGKGTKQACAGC
jgi:tetratricopeptide (TPR) repeat protein